MRRVITYLSTVVALVMGMFGATAQELKVGADFVTLFDNREYASMTYYGSGTLFSARLTPKVGVAWAERNELTFAVDMVQDFGHGSKFLSDANVQLYYAYRAPRVKVFAGIFPFSEMRGLQSPLFFDRIYRYYHNRMSGVLARYESTNRDNGYIEFAMDYTGMRDFNTRESFMIMMSARLPFEWAYMGYDFSMGHYAKDYNPDTHDGVVDNLMFIPYVGFDLHTGGFDFDLRLSYLQSLQRDRVREDIWELPCGGELYTSISRWGVTLANRLYVGRGLMTYYDRYGSDLYYGTPFYATKEHIYDEISASYKQRFFSDTVAVEAGITMEYDGTGWGTRQWLQLSVDLDYGISLKAKNRVIE